MDASKEDNLNAMRGYKATLNNPNVSEAAKQHARDVLDNELGGDQPREQIHSIRGDQNKDPTRVAAGYKAAQHNPNVTEGAPRRDEPELESNREHQRAILDRQLHGLDSEASPNKNVFTYASLSDRIILSVSSICAAITGALNPLVPVIYGLLVSVFDGFEAGTVEASELRSKVATFSLYYVYLSIALFVFTYVATVGFYYAGDRIARALRTAYLSAILRQDVAFFDTLGPGEIMAGSFRAWVPCRRRLPVNLW